MNTNDDEGIQVRASQDRIRRQDVIYPGLSHSIVGAAMKVLHTLKPGLSEKAYENALVIELKKQGHIIDQERRFEVLYDGILVDALVPDLLVDGLVVVGPKVVTEFNDTHVAQMIGYLARGAPSLTCVVAFAMLTRPVHPDHNPSTLRHW